MRERARPLDACSLCLSLSHLNTVRDSTIWSFASPSGREHPPSLFGPGTRGSPCKRSKVARQPRTSLTESPHPCDVRMCSCVYARRRWEENLKTTFIIYFFTLPCACYITRTHHTQLSTHTIICFDYGLHINYSWNPDVIHFCLFCPCTNHCLRNFFFVSFQMSFLAIKYFAFQLAQGCNYTRGAYTNFQPSTAAPVPFIFKFKLSFMIICSGWTIYYVYYYTRNTWQQNVYIIIIHKRFYRER